MAGEGQFTGGAEDADLDAVAELGGGVAREDEGGFLECGFAGEGEHFGVGETAGVGEDDELVAGQALGGEDVDLDVREAAIRESGVVGGGGVVGQRSDCCGGGDTAYKGASGEFHWAADCITEGRESGKLENRNWKIGNSSGGERSKSPPSERRGWGTRPLLSHGLCRT
jgi:hypothetical protein